MTQPTKPFYEIYGITDSIMCDTSAHYKLTFPEPVGNLYHKYTNASIAVYEHIPKFKQYMLKWCFGLTYTKN